MKKVLLILFLIALIGGAVYVVFLGKLTGTVVFKSDPGVAPFQITSFDGDVWECAERECAIKLGVGEHTFFLEKNWGQEVMIRNVT